MSKQLIAEAVEMVTETSKYGSWEVQYSTKIYQVEINGTLNLIENNYRNSVQVGGGMYPAGTEYANKRIAQVRGEA